ncbi:tetratricopeptide repeat protein [Cellvibrio sp.]
MINLLTRVCVFAGVLVIVGCTTSTHQPQTPAPVISKPTSVVKPGEPAVVQPQPGAVPKPVPVIALNPAAQSLAKQARQQYLSQDYQGAIATAERGLRIERRAADLYLVLAQSYVQLALPEKAKMFVQQGLRFAAPGSDVAQGLARVQEMVDQGY